MDKSPKSIAKMKKDKASDRKRGIKEGSARDEAIDARNGINEEPGKKGSFVPFAEKKK